MLYTPWWEKWGIWTHFNIIYRSILKMFDVHISMYAVRGEHPWSPLEMVHCTGIYGELLFPARQLSLRAPAAFPHFVKSGCIHGSKKSKIVETQYSPKTRMKSLYAIKFHLSKFTINMQNQFWGKKKKNSFIVIFERAPSSELDMYANKMAATLAYAIRKANTLTDLH